MKRSLHRVQFAPRASSIFRPRASIHFFSLFILSLAFAMVFPRRGMAEVNYIARFKLEKQTFVVGEPIFVDFIIQNTGARTFAFRYRLPSRALEPGLESEPQFRVKDASGRALSDPAPHPCGGATGSVVYGSVTLPPGQTHTERWLLNEWARFAHPGRFRVSAKRRLPLMAIDPVTKQMTSPPAAYALAIDDLSLDVEPSSDAELRAAFKPYLDAITGNSPLAAEEAMLALTTLPHAFFLDRLAAWADAPAKNRQWSREQVLEGLARLGATRAWDAILKVASGEGSLAPQRTTQNNPPGEELIRSFAILLLGEKRDPRFVPALAKIVAAAPEPFRGDALQALGFFNDPRATRILFDKLHSAETTDRVNAILGLKNLGNRDVLPALLAMLNDPQQEVRQVANFSLRTLTGRKIGLPVNSTPAATRRAAGQWRVWWREHGASFIPQTQPPCHDW